MTHLVLFDIDGTLLTSNGAASRAFRQALTEVFGTSGPTSGYSFAGRTDPQIARDLLTMAGLSAEAIEEGAPAAWERYLELLEVELERTPSTRLPGVARLLDEVEQRSEGVLGLLTGNLAEGARLKLRAVGIERDRFRVGAFGSDHHDRRALPLIAVDRAEETVGKRFEGKSVVIIGDTPHDIACGEHLGVRTVAVATGTFTQDELAACGPDHLFQDLIDTDAVLDAIFA